MSRMRKTINVWDFVEACNRYLAAPSTTAQQRYGMIAAVEQALHMANAYRGFVYQHSEHAQGDEPTLPGSVLRADYDDTRRCYIIRRDLT